MMSLFHPAISALAFFQSTQLNLFERFLTQAVSGIDSTSITSGMQNVSYVVLLTGFLWQVYHSAMHGGDVRGLGTNLIKYLLTAVVIMNYHAIFTDLNQGFVNGANWINSASGGTDLLGNWASDLLSHFTQIGYQNLWGMVTAGVPGLIDGLLIIVAYVLYPFVVVIFGFFYILYGSMLYIFGPIVIALMPLGAANRLAKSYAENIFIWNAWPILYGGFGALLSAVQMGQIGQILDHNNFLGGLGNLEGSILIGLASIIYSLAIAVIPFIAKKIVTGEVGATAGALLGAAATALTMGVAAAEGAVAGASGGASATHNQTGGAPGNGAGSAATGAGSKGSANQPAPQQRPSPSQTGTGHTNRSAESGASQVAQTAGERQASTIRGDLSNAMEARPSSQDAGVPNGGIGESSHTQAADPQSSQHSRANDNHSGSAPSRSSSSSGRSQNSGTSSQLMRPHGLASWGAYHAARLATQGGVGGVRAAGSAAKSAASSIANPVESAGKVGEAAGAIAGTAVNAAEKTATVAGKVASAMTRPRQTAAAGVHAVGDAARGVASNASSAVRGSAEAVRSNFSRAYERTRTAEKGNNEENS